EPLAAGDRLDDQVHEQLALVAALEAELAAEVTELAELAAADLQAAGAEALVLLARRGTELPAALLAERPTARETAAELLLALRAAEGVAEALEVLGAEHLAEDGQLRVLEEQVLEELLLVDRAGDRDGQVRDREDPGHLLFQSALEGGDLD